MKELALGDYLIYEVEGSGNPEKRKVNMVLSAKSCGLEEAFTNDIIHKAAFKY
jgi:hypothetical protein